MKIIKIILSYLLVPYKKIWNYCMEDVPSSEKGVMGGCVLIGLTFATFVILPLVVCFFIDFPHIFVIVCVLAVLYKIGSHLGKNYVDNE